MLIEVKVPVLPESVTEATLVNWHKKAGEPVGRDENLVDVETDKVVLELPAPGAGVLTEIRKPDGSTVAAQEVIAVIDTEGKNAGAAAPAARVAGTAPAVAPTPGAPSPSAAPAGAPSPAAPDGEADALPAARKLMAEAGLRPEEVSGTGRGGRATKGDVLAAAARAGAAAGAPQARGPQPAPTPVQAPPVAPPPVQLPPGLSARPEQRVPMSRLRQRVAERLVQSQSTAAILTTFNEVNMATVIELRNRYKERFEREHGVKLGFMGFFVKAVVHALKRFPMVNASIDGGDIVYHGYFDIGIAVGSPRGLVVPILRDADQMSIADIERQIADFGQRAQDGKLAVEELTGGTYTISNGGVFGSMLSTPIINPPQSAILGVHATRERAVVENGQVVVRPMNYLAQSYDHRIIDGREAVLSLMAIKEALEDPARLLLDL
ncbi:MAG TPA: 2-oxoglutarate dehydrogenase complex dihydrolipoyllysine-residue succinyltransferase [Casimicrobiaceae bacterium]|nr:2-oxoglutarate dehydrogenase complex dihydrolipoyllysine-residue succinyltransferase [Casimicrobiaceae bacterium]